MNLTNPTKSRKVCRALAKSSAGIATPINRRALTRSFEACFFTPTHRPKTIYGGRHEAPSGGCSSADGSCKLVASAALCRLQPAVADQAQTYAEDPAMSIQTPRACTPTPLLEVA